jgi:hypothetical protein
MMSVPLNGLVTARECQPAADHGQTRHVVANLEDEVRNFHWCAQSTTRWCNDEHIDPARPDELVAWPTPPSLGMDACNARSLVSYNLQAFLFLSSWQMACVCGVVGQTTKPVQCRLASLGPGPICTQLDGRVRRVAAGMAREHPLASLLSLSFLRRCDVNRLAQNIRAPARKGAHPSVANPRVVSRLPMMRLPTPTATPECPTCSCKDRRTMGAHLRGVHISCVSPRSQFDLRLPVRAPIRSIEADQCPALPRTLVDLNRAR